MRTGNTPISDVACRATRIRRSWLVETLTRSMPLICGLSILFGLNPDVVHAADRFWVVNAPDGKWNVPERWSGGVPGVNDNASIVVQTPAGGVLLDATMNNVTLMRFTLGFRDSPPLFTIKQRRFTANGQAEIGRGKLVLDDAVWDGAGTLKTLAEPNLGEVRVLGTDSIAATIDHKGALLVEAQGRNAELKLRHDFTNAGSCTFRGDGLVDVIAKSGSRGKFTNSGGLFILDGGGHRRITGEFDNTSTGKLTIDDSRLLVRVGLDLSGPHSNSGTILLKTRNSGLSWGPPDTFTNKRGGRIEGKGTLLQSPTRLPGDFIDPGIRFELPPGKAIASAATFESAGILTIEGDYVEQESCTVVIDIAGPTVETEYDRLLIMGSASLAGLLDVNLIEPFVPTPFDTFEVVVAEGGRTGFYSNASAVVFFEAGSFEVTYTPTSVLLRGFQGTTATEQTSWGGIKARFQ